MPRRTGYLLAGLVLLLAIAGCADYWVVGYGVNDCWYDSYGNLYCGDGFYYGGVYTSATGHPVASHEVLRLVNDERTAAGLEPLALAEDLARVACAHAEDMDVRNFEGSVTPDGRTLADRLADVGRAPPRTREARLVADVAPEDVVAAWMADPAARAAVLDPALREAGVGVHATEGMTWWVIVFVGA